MKCGEIWSGIVCKQHTSIRLKWRMGKSVLQGASALQCRQFKLLRFTQMIEWPKCSFSLLRAHICEWCNLRIAARWSEYESHISTYGRNILFLREGAAVVPPTQAETYLLLRRATAGTSYELVSVYAGFEYCSDWLTSTSVGPFANANIAFIHICFRCRRLTCYIADTNCKLSCYKSFRSHFCKPRAPHTNKNLVSMGDFLR